MTTHERLQNTLESLDSALSEITQAVIESHKDSAISPEQVRQLTEIRTHILSTRRAARALVPEETPVSIRRFIWVEGTQIGTHEGFIKVRKPDGAVVMVPIDEVYCHVVD